MNRELIIQVGQRMMTGFKGTKIPKELIETVKKQKIGNFILFGENIESAAQVKALCAELRDIALSETGHEPLISADQEGGRVERLPKDVVSTPSARKLAESGDENAAFEAGRRIGEALRELGLNYDLAPVLDVESVAGSRAIGDRSFGTDADTVSRFGCMMIKGIQSAGVLACAKHFPGHGGTAVDTHKSMPTITLDLKEIENVHLAPFRAAAAAGVKSIMSTHILFNALDDELPATLSRRVLTGLLRRDMGFDGIIITDCLEMGAIVSQYGTEQAALMAVGAGADMPLISHNCDKAGRAVEMMAEALDFGKLDGAEHHAALERILGAKEWLNMQ